MTESPELLNMPKNLNTYLGQKGYTILKSDLSIKQQTTIKEALMVKPYTPGSPIQNANTTFPVYRESGNKLYLPRHFGERYFGPPKEYKIPEGDDIDLVFNGSLRDYQVPVVEKFLDESITSKGGGLLELPCAFGKCLGINTKVLMYDGSIRLVQDIKVGDVLMGDDSTPRNVLSLARGREMMYKISSKKGDEYIVNESHILSLKSSSNYNKNIRKGTIVDISVKDYLNLPKTFHGKAGILYGYKVGIDFEYKEVDLDPYLLGFWLGDGSSASPIITTQEGCIIKYLVELFKTKYTELCLIYRSKYDYKIDVCGKFTGRDNMFMRLLRKYSLLKNKHIPDIYKHNTREIRLQVLAGLLDSDGYNKGGCYEITQKNHQLAEDIVFLARSLGFASYAKRVTKVCTNSRNGRVAGQYTLVSIYGSGLEQIPVLCKRKKCEPRRLIKSALSYRISVEKLQEDDYYGFEIDGNKRFVLGDFSVTHNTSLSLYLLTQLRKKTIVIVHKEFLLNQWVERIKQFLPSARIGRIQGQTIDIENKDIVLCMLQSLSMKEYDSKIFDSFGFTIIDECHHISSEVFSRALFKLVTKYMLGLSATMNRKDGTTKVFKMFLGEVVYKAVRNKDEQVVVRGITYKTNDDDFNEISTDFRGNVAYSTMISKLCSFSHRTEFIIRVIQDMVKENPQVQIMVIAHNKNVLNYIHDAIEHRQIASVGYYVGGMKEAQLKKSEDKQIVIATYQMASEGLDIKTLNALVMVSPKTDIEQTVGRILRQKHASPVVVDIVDTHEPFQKQWMKRKKFYKTQNYKIIETDSNKYTTNYSKWRLSFQPSWVDTCDPSESSSSSDNESNDDDQKPVGKCLIKLKK
jgi:superfamily II DNA or RNA helicase